MSTDGGERLHAVLAMLCDAALVLQGCLGGICWFVGRHLSTWHDIGDTWGSNRRLDICKIGPLLAVYLPLTLVIRPASKRHLNIMQKLGRAGEAGREIYAEVWFSARHNCESQIS